MKKSSKLTNQLGSLSFITFFCLALTSLIFRYCNFKLSKGSKLLSLEEILELKTKAHDPSLTERLEALLEESRRKEMEGSGTKEVDFCNEKLPLKNEKVLLCLHKVEEIDVNLRGIGGEEKNFEEKLG